MTKFDDEMKKASNVIPSPSPGVKTGIVTQTTSTDVEANTLSQAESRQQGEKRVITEKAAPAKPAYNFEIEHGTHKVTVVPQQGLSYNYYASCTCAWQGRYLNQDSAENGAKAHIEAHFPSRG